jgi:hypothetical protein
MKACTIYSLPVCQSIIEGPIPGDLTEILLMKSPEAALLITIAFSKSIALLNDLD